MIVQNYGPSRAGVFKSMNGGAGWFEANKGLPSLDVRDIEIDYLRPSIIYAGLYRYESSVNPVCWTTRISCSKL